MRALIWIVEDTWETTVAQAKEVVPPGAELTLLHVEPAGAEEVARGARAGLLGRSRPGPPEPVDQLRPISEAAAQALLAEAQARLGRAATCLTRRGRPEHEVIACLDGIDLLVLARDGDRGRPGPHSLGPATRFVVDHAPCRVLLVWP